MQSDEPRAKTGETGADPEVLRGLPAVGRLLESGAVSRLVERGGAALVTALVREEVDRLREEARGGLGPDDLARRAAPERIAGRVSRRLDALLAPAPRTVVNATGVVVHTNLGRSILSPEAAARVAASAEAYVDLEYDLERGRRGSRGSHLEPLLDRLFPGSASLAVNNNAAAILIALRAIARRREVVVSRGELVEIGGAFRVPDIMAASGARLKEVGTTNRTRLPDYEAAIGSKTAMLLKVHTSNFRIVGFTEEATVADLAALARSKGLPLVVDWGSGDLVDLGPLGIHDEMPVARILEAGADVVTFSGDKLLGGPQCGYAVGRRDLIETMRRDPMARVCRLDRLLVAAARETLAAYLTGRAFEAVPTLCMLALEPEAIGVRAEAVRRKVVAEAGGEADLSIVDGVSRTGGGSSPAGERPTRLIAVSVASGDAGSVERRLRSGNPPVVGRVHEGKLLLDLRTVLPDQDDVLAERLAACLKRRSAR